MKIAMIGLRGIPAKSGGVETVVENLAPLLVKLGADVTVYCRNPYCKERLKEFKGVKLKYLPTLNTKFTEALSHTFISSLNATFDGFDVVHYHAMGNGLFAFLPKITKKKTVVTLHGLDYEREKWGRLAKAYLKFSERMISKVPDRVISVSNKIKKHYKKNYNKEITFIPNGINMENPRPIKLLKKYGLKKDNYILFLSRIVPEKGVHYLINAFKDVKTDLKLVIAGDATHTDKYFEELKVLAKDDDRIIFTGPLYGESKYEAFSNARFFILPSTIEGMPIVLLEAMSFGCCPLTSNIEENMEVNQGFSFKSKDVSDLGRKIELMIRNPKQVKAKGAICRSFVRSHYQWNDIAKQHLNIYKELVK